MSRLGVSQPQPKRGVILFLVIGVLFFSLVSKGYTLLKVRAAAGTLFSLSTTASKDVQEAGSVVPKTYRVGIQAGHWKNTELPAELSKLYWSTGTSAAGYNEWEVNLEIAQDVETLLEKQGVKVDLLPATVPVDYQADAFVAIHADGNDDSTVSGYKVAPSEWDTDGRAEALSESIASAYGADTDLMPDSALAISDDMTQYYAFNFAKYQHSIDAETPGVLVEAGYLTNYSDRQQLTASTENSAQGIADGIMQYLHSKGSQQ